MPSGRVEAEMESLFPFPYGSFLPLQHAGYHGALRITDDPA
jgi:hypothetical protein